MNKRLISLFLTLIIFISGGIGVIKGVNPLNDLQINAAENAEAVAGFTAGNPLAMGVASAAGNAVKQGINKGFDNIDVGEVVVSGTVGLVSAGAGKVAAKAITKISSTAINKAGKIVLSALTEGTIEAGLDVGRQGIEIATGKRESIDLIQTVTSFGIGMMTGGFQTKQEIEILESRQFNKDNTYYRAMSDKELEAVQESGKLRGGREGETYFTDKGYDTKLKVQSELSLPSKPDVIMEFQISNDINVIGPKFVNPKYWQIGGGIEFFTNDQVLVKIKDIIKLK